MDTMHRTNITTGSGLRGDEDICSLTSQLAKMGKGVGLFLIGLWTLEKVDFRTSASQKLPEDQVARDKCDKFQSDSFFVLNM